MRGLAATLGRAPDESAIRRALSAFDACYRDNLFRASRLYPGAAAVLAEIGAAGCVAGCITNKREDYARALLEQAGIADRLRFVCGGDSFPRRKPDPEPLLGVAAAHGLEPAACVMIGDSANDRRAAAAAGFEFVFAAYGYARPDDPELTDGLAVITSLDALPRLLCLRQAAK